jgi:subtilisin family serine protease
MISGLARCLGLGLSLSLAIAGIACAHVPSPSPATVDPEREVLVMLRLPPDHLRPNADYGGGWDTSGAAARRRLVNRLARENGLTLVDDWPMPMVAVDCYVLETPSNQPPAAIAARLSREPGVAWSEPMNLYQAQGEALPRAATHNDPLYLMQPTAREWRLADLHRVATGRNVHVAVIDSMVETTHPDLVGQVEISQDFVRGHASGPELHGTAVAGVIAARADNGIGIAGIAPRSRLMALRSCWQTDRAGDTICDSLSLAKGLDFAIGHSAQVINMSLSGPSDILLGKLLDAALARRVVVVAAFDRNLPGGGFPASHPGVVAVADETWGAPPKGVYSAPGLEVPVTLPGGRWGLLSGSSLAAAEVSGFAALLRERAGEADRSLKMVAGLPAGGSIDACATLLGAAACASVPTGVREVSAALR